MFESGCTKHAIVRRELDQLLTWAGCNGVFVQISVKAIKRIINVLINVSLSFVWLTVVVVVVVALIVVAFEKQFVLNILSVRL